MARPLRIEYAGALYHVTSRGDRREAIYFSDTDRRAWLGVLADACERFNWRCHGWCQMTNHYHVVLETIEGNLARGMRQLNGVYTQYVNRAHQRVGHVFQGRYKAVLVQKEAHLLELARYVVLNPVRAGMVADAALWPWSSYGAMVGTTPAPSWLETDWLLRQFGADRPSAVREFAAFVRAGVNHPSVWQSLRQQIYLGDADFAQRMQALSEDSNANVHPASLAEVPRMQRRALALPLDAYVSRHPSDPKAGMRAAHASGDFTQAQIAAAFGVHYATVSRAVNKRGGRDA